MKLMTGGDSGGGEAAAVLGEDHGEFLAFLARPIEVPLHHAVSEGGLASGLLLGLGVVEVFCLVYALEQGKPTLGALLVLLLVAKLIFFARNLVGDRPVWSLENRACLVCHQDFQVAIEDIERLEHCGSLFCARRLAEGLDASGIPIRKASKSAS
jgi:hypothetical protein